MKKKIISILVLLIIFQTNFAQDITTVEAKSADISENLDLDAVASVFGDSKDLEDFEYKLNDPELQISNLDLNRDGYVDYLRVLGDSENQTVLITIQAVLGKDIYQDVATIDVEKDNRGKTHVQVVGDVYMYGPDYIIEPVYIYSPPVVLYFWSSNYHRWDSPYYWHHYPSHYYPWQPYSCYVYHSNVHVHVNVNNRYYYRNSRRSVTASYIHNRTRRNDYANRYPDRSFSARNSGVRNSYELRERRGETHANVDQAGSVRRTSNSNSLHSTRINGSNSVNNGPSRERNQSSLNNSSRTRSASGQVRGSNTSRNSSRGEVQSGTSSRRVNRSGGAQSGVSYTKQTNSRESRTSQSSPRHSSNKSSSNVRSGRSNSNRPESQGSRGNKSGNSSAKERGRR